MKKTITILSSLVLVLILACGTAAPSFAGESHVTYQGKAKDFVFQPGSSYSPTDLFTNFKGVMPGDQLTQQIQVKNDASKKVKVKLYIKALGPAELQGANGGQIVSKEDSADFLKEMNLTVTQDGKSELFQAPADQTDGLTDWVCLGTFYSGADVMLNVSLDVPITMGNDYQDRIGALDWQFMAEEYPISKDDPKAAKTGDDMNIWLYAGIGAVALLAAGLVFATRRKKSE